MPQSDANAAGSTGSTDASSKIQSALQADTNLSGITATVNGNTVELTGTANSAKDRKRAAKIAKQNANGMKVVDHITVASNNSTTTSH
jgi:osmotically-inducible protein OsmY